MINQNQVRQILKLKNDAIVLSWYGALLNAFDKYDINSNRRIAAFLAQTGHESNSFTVLQENLNYSADGLVSTFKHYFPTKESTLGYARMPEKIANRVYASRMGNGDEASGDGWKYRGRGLIQLTGHDNYEKFASTLNMTIDECVTYAATNLGAADSAGWFWKENGLNVYADKGDMLGLTKRINGGILGISERVDRYNVALKVLSST